MQSFVEYLVTSVLVQMYILPQNTMNNFDTSVIKNITSYIKYVDLQENKLNKTEKLKEKEIFSIQEYFFCIQGCTNYVEII